MATAAVNPGNPVQSLNVGGPQLSSTAAAVGAMNAGAVSDGTADRTMAAVMKMGETILAPQLDAARKEQFASGVQRAATGEALEDILKDQPAWTQIFGTTAAVDGARAYTAQAKIGEFGATMEKEMPALAKLPPEALSKRAADHMAGMMTGDQVTDAAIQMAYVEQLQPLYKRHAKEHYKYQQNQAAAAQVSAWDQAFDAYQSRSKAYAQDPTMFTEQDMAAEKDRLIGILQPFADQSDDSYEKGILQTMQGAAAKGNFAAVKLLEDAGVMKSMPPDTQAKMQSFLSQSARTALGQAMPDYALDVAMIVNDTAQNPAGVAKRITDFNAKVARELGIDEKYASMIPPSTVDNVVGRVLNAQAAAANQSVDPRPEQLAMANTLLMHPGELGKAVSIGRVPQGVAEEAALAQWTANTDPQFRANLLNARGAGTYSTLKEDLKQMGPAFTDKNTKGVEQVAKTFALMNDETRGAYFSTDEGNFLDRYNSAVRAGVPPEQAFLSAKIAIPLARDVIPEGDKTAVGKAIRAEAERRNENFFGWNTVDDQSLRVIEAMISRDYRKNSNQLDMKTSVARSFSQALENGLEIVGKHAIIGRQQGQKPLTTILAYGENNMGATKAAETFEKVVAQKIADVGGDLNSYVLYRAPDYNGDARFLVEAVDKDGAIKTTTISGRELRQYKPKPGVIDSMGGGAAFGVYPRTGPAKE